MSVLTVMNPKGGSGKTTTALLIAQEMAQQGATVCLIDADPAGWLTQWHILPGVPENIRFSVENNPSRIAQEIQAQKAENDLVVIDVEGSANLTVGTAVGISDFVLIPMQGSVFDASGAVQSIELIKSQELIARRTIPYSVVITRTNAAVKTRSYSAVREALESHNANILETTIVERAAYRELMERGGTLYSMDRSKVSNLEKAVENSQALTREVMRTWQLQNSQMTEGQGV